MYNAYSLGYWTDVSRDSVRWKDGTRTLAIRQQLLEVDRLPPLRVSCLGKSILACWRFARVQVAVSCSPLQKKGKGLWDIVYDSNSKVVVLRLTRLKSPFGRLLHLFLVPECDFNFGYQSADEVANDLEPERKPITAFSREVEENIEERNAGCCSCRDVDSDSFSHVMPARSSQRSSLLVFYPRSFHPLPQ